MSATNTLAVVFRKKKVKEREKESELESEPEPEPGRGGPVGRAGWLRRPWLGAE